MSHTRRTLRANETTEGHGNCAFNAFILGLCQADVLNNIEENLRNEDKTPDDEFSKFIRAAGSALELDDGSDWAAVKQKILALRNRDDVKLQNDLAQVMRDLAVDLAEDDEQVLVNAEEPLMSAFNSHFSAERGVQDDIYTKHTFITTKFNEIHGALTEEKKENIRSLPVQEEIRGKIIAWWMTPNSEDMPTTPNGYQQFLSEMRKNGTWAGDLELKQLANYFHINLDLYDPCNSETHHIYRSDGPTTITLSNRNGIHWSNTQPASQEEALQRPSIAAAVRELETVIINKFDGGELKHDKNKWKEIIERREEEAVEKAVSYSTENIENIQEVRELISIKEDKTIDVSTAKQIALDKVLAIKLQQAEYDDFLARKRNHRRP